MSTGARTRIRTRLTAAGGLAALALAAGLAAAPAANAAPVRAGAGAPCAAAAHGGVRLPVGRGGHVVFAVAAGYGTTYATVTECARTRGGWRQILRVPGRIGTKGYAPPGEKREGDGRTPSGSYSIDRAFGLGNPGTRLRYHRLRASNECWGSTIGTPEYNRYFHGTCRDTDEDLVAIAKEGQYREAAVINYNRPPDSPVVPGLGSAIFLHINGSGATAGCVSVPAGDVDFILRTLRPGDRILMGTSAVLFRG
ncbi:MAG TPA: L,D-transpeptidase family protein [Streptosporangiaceae bacterium]